MIKRRLAWASWHEVLRRPEIQNKGQNSVHSAPYHHGWSPGEKVKREGAGCDSYRQHFKMVPDDVLLVGSFDEHVRWVHPALHPRSPRVKRDFVGYGHSSGRVLRCRAQRFANAHRQARGLRIVEDSCGEDGGASDSKRGSKSAKLRRDLRRRRLIACSKVFGPVGVRVPGCGCSCNIERGATKVLGWRPGRYLIDQAAPIVPTRRALPPTAIRAVCTPYAFSAAALVQLV